MNRLGLEERTPGLVLTITLVGTGNGQGELSEPGQAKSLVLVRELPDLGEGLAWMRELPGQGQGTSSHE